MIRPLSACLAALLVLSLSATAQAPPNLTIVNFGPQGEIASLDEANEIRIVFSEPMVTLGRIPEQVTASYVRISPAIAGTYRWSGTTTLIFTPDPKRLLPFATTYTVTVSTAAAAVSGRKLANPERFTFTTPTVKLLQTNSYRRGGTVDTPMVILLRFNQPVRPADIQAALSARLQPHRWESHQIPAEGLARLRTIAPDSLDRFNAKVRATREIAASTAPVGLRLTNDWDKKRYPPSRDLVAFEVRQLAPESHVKLTLAATVRSPAGPASPASPQEYIVQAEPAFFVQGFWCSRACDGDRRNPILFRTGVRTADFAREVSAVDVTRAPERPVAKSATPRQRDFNLDWVRGLTIEDAGFAAQPADTRYAVTVPATLKSVDGQTLGYTWIGVAENWHMRAFTSFGDGHGVWEKDGGALLPFYARNMSEVTQWASPVRPNDLMPLLMRLQDKGFDTVPDGSGIVRRMGGSPDRVLSHGLDMSTALRNGLGLVWAAVREGDPIPRARRYNEGEERARDKSTVVQVTNLGITVKDSPLNTLVFVTRLDNGAPVANASVSIVRTDNTTFWRGTTNASGLALAPNTRLRDPDNTWRLSFIVTAEKDGDVAYVGSDWNEGISPWEFGTNFNLRESVPLLRGSVFTDRGVYRLGEEIHLKAVLRHNTPEGVRLLAPQTPLVITVRDSQNRVVDERTVRASGWSSAEWTMTLPKEGSLGGYSLRAMLESDVPKPDAKRTPAEEEEGDDFYRDYHKAVHGSFLVAAYRRPDFRVDVTLTGGAAIAGDPLKGVVSARYLFGAAMGPRPVTWRYSKSPSSSVPSAITERFSEDRWEFVGPWGYDEGERPEQGDIRREETKLLKDGSLAVGLDTKRDAGRPYLYSLEADVEDASRQHIANRASITVHPAPWYIGVRKPASYFVQQKSGYQTQIVAAGLDGTPVAGVPVDVTLTQVQWISVRRAEGNGFYTWDTERKLVPAGKWTVTTAADPVGLTIPLPGGGYFMVEAAGRGENGRFAVTRTSFYVLGRGYTAWQRFDHNRIELTPERQTYRPGDTARIMIQSPWERATALVTTEREGIRSQRQFTLTSTQESISIPVTEHDIPNVFVSVVLIKGRTAAPTTAAESAEKVDADPSDPGKPAFRMGYTELKVEDRSKRLTVAVSANRQEYRPASAANVRLDVKDAQGRGVASEVTLWAVDYGVLSLTSYQAPDIASAVYAPRALQVMNADNRQRIIARRVLTPKGSTEGGGGGVAGDVRKDFRALAFWIGSVTTAVDGTAAVDVKLPESLTTYRIMAVAADRASRFGSGDAEVRTNKPLTLKPTFPRFMAVGDRAFFGAVVGSQLPRGGTATVTMKSLDPAVLAFTGPLEKQVTVTPGGSLEVRFEANARTVGRARVQMTVKLGEESDAFEDVIPVEILVSPETVAAYGEAAGSTTTASESITLPASVVPGFGGLRVEVASTALVGLGEGARYLVQYPYGCAEQKASRVLALSLAADLGDAFSLPGIDTAQAKPAVQAALKELETFQCADGGFAYWPGRCWTGSPYLTAYLLHVFKVAADLGYDVNRGVRDRAYAYLEGELAAPPPVNEGWWPAYTAWQSFAVKVLVEGGRNQDSNITRLYGYRERMPVFALSYLHDALIAKKEATGDRVSELRRRMNNAVLPEGGSSHVEELGDPYLLWFWNSNIRSTAIVLNSQVKAGVTDISQIRPLVRWLMNARKNGRWSNTQENAYALEALVNYYRRFEPESPDFSALVRLGNEELSREEFRTRTTTAEITELPMTKLLASAAPGTSQPLTFAKEGTGTLFYNVRLQYAADALTQKAMDTGFHVERRYEPFVETGARPATTTYQAGDLVRVTLTFRLPKERRFVAVTDPLPAGFEAVESWFNTTSQQLAAQQDRQQGERFDSGELADSSDWQNWFRSGGFDHIERHDDRIQLFATRLSEGLHEFSYIVRATTVGTFRTAPARAEEMYSPEIFGRTGTTTIEVKR